MQRFYKTGAACKIWTENKKNILEIFRKFMILKMRNPNF